MNNTDQITAEVRVELQKWHKWASADAVLADLPNANISNQQWELLRRTERVVEVQGSLINALLWSLGEPVHRDCVASWAGVAHGMSYGCIAHEVCKDGVGTGRRDWSTHT